MKFGFLVSRKLIDRSAADPYRQIYSTRARWKTWGTTSAMSVTIASSLPTTQVGSHGAGAVAKARPHERSQICNLLIR